MNGHRQKHSKIQITKILSKDGKVIAEAKPIELKEKKKWITSKLYQKQATIPVTVKEELNTNIFLRCDSFEVKKSLSMENSTELEVFKKLRDLKDVF